MAWRTLRRKSLREGIVFLIYADATTLDDPELAGNGVARETINES
jgi:hypothetical protein